MVSQVVENQTRVSKISNILACKSTYSKEICLSCTKSQRRAIKNRAFSEFKVNFRGLLSTKSFRKQFSLKNIELDEQLLLKPLLILVFSLKFYLVKMCPILDSSSLAFGARYQSFLRVCLFLHEGVTNFVYPSEKFNNPTDVNQQPSLKDRPFAYGFQEKQIQSLSILQSKKLF